MFEKSFIEKCLDGEADIFELDNYIEFWHTHDTDVSLRDFLGLTPYEYEMWGRSNDSIFRDILRCRMDNINFEEYEGMNESDRLAARSYDAEAIAKLKNKKDEDE